MTNTVLLVDDDPDTVELMQWMLKEASEKSLVANSGEVALDLYKENKDNIDLIISDILMPGLNGHELLDEIRKENPSVRTEAKLGPKQSRGAVTADESQLGTRGRRGEPGNRQSKGPRVGRTYLRLWCTVDALGSRTNVSKC